MRSPARLGAVQITSVVRRKKMPLTVGRYTFEGPYNDTVYLQDRAGVYLIVCHSNGKYYPIDVGESAMVKTRVENHDRKPCWERRCHSTLEIAVLYTPHLQQAGRQQIEQEIRKMFGFPCGQR